MDKIISSLFLALGNYFISERKFEDQKTEYHLWLLQSKMHKKCM